MVDHKLILGDVRRMSGYFEGRAPFVDTIITSPPYWNIKNYGDIQDQIGFGQSKEDYLADLRKVFEDCYNVTKQTGCFWLIVDTYRDNGILELLPLELAQLAKEIGWNLKERIIWDKQYGLPWHGKGQMRNVTEEILFFSKTNKFKYYPERIKTLDEISKWWVDFPERFNPKGKTPTNIWRYPTRRRGTWPKPSVINHLCPFPTGLVARIIELTTNEGDLVFDPFAGSGVVLAQAEVMKRKALGFEINQDYVVMFETEVRKEVRNEWIELREWREKLGKSRESFETTILKLRALKYCRKVSQAFVESLHDDQKEKVKAVICTAEIPKHYTKGIPLEVNIWIIGDRKHRIFIPAIKVARERMWEPPLSHYEIDASIDCGKYSDLIKTFPNIDKNDEFFLYPSQQPRGYTHSKPLGRWFEAQGLEEVRNRNGTPPLLANFAEDVSWVLD